MTISASPWTTAAMTVALLMPHGAVHAQEQIVDYMPFTPVHDIQNIAMDLRSIGEVLKHSLDQAAFERARLIFEKGGHSESMAKLELREGLRFFLNFGDEISGTSISGAPIRATVMDDYVIGDKEIHVLYHQDVGCYVGGLASPDTRGCFTAEGEIVADGEDPVPYFYNIADDNYNDRTLRKLSREAEQEFETSDGNLERGWFSEYAKFVDYYGSPSYADDILQAAFTGGTHKFEKHEFNFKKWSPEDRAWYVENGADYLNIAMHIVGELEQAQNKCVEGCDPICNRESIKHLDQAVAYFTGSLYDTDGEGNMLYGLADRMCKLFKTCGWDGDSVTGTSHVNLLSFARFKKAQGHMAEGRCEDAELDMRIIAKRVFIPLWQGLLYSAYHGYRKEASLFSVATLPILAKCSPGHVEQIYSYFLPDSTEKIHFPYMKRIMEDHYHCTMLDCKSVGGLWNPSTNDYHGHGEPCDQANIHAAQAPEEPSSAGLIVGVVGLCLVVFTTGILVFRRMRWNRLARQSGVDPDEEPNIAAGQKRGEII